MTGICGCFSGRPANDTAEVLRRMLAPPAETGCGGNGARIQSGGVGIGAFETVPKPVLLEFKDLLLAFVGHPWLRSEHGRSSDPTAIARAVEEQGSAAFAALGGDFALAAWNSNESRGLLAIDRIGVRQLTYAQVNGGLAFASSLDVLVRHPDVTRELSYQGVFDYLYFHVCPGPQTIYRGLNRLAPGHFIEFDATSESKPRPYWAMRFEENSREDFESLKTNFRAVLRDAVATASSGAACGAFLSGGTDSSTVSGLLARASGARPKTFSIGFDASGYDEMNFARITARHFNCDHHEYYVTPADVVSAAPRVAAHYDQPFGNASAIPVYYCAALARDSGVERLLAGDGGDELFGGNERYAKQHLLDLYHRVPNGLRRAVIEPLVLSTPVFKALPGLRKLRSYVEQAEREMPQRYETQNLLSHLDPRKVLTSEFLSAVHQGQPHDLMRATHAPYADSSLINQMLAVDLRFTLADSDLPKVTRMCEMAGTDVAFPLLDEGVVEFSSLLPAEMKLRGSRLRYFFKEALRDLLPAEVISKQKHGFGLPVGAWLTGHRPLLDLASDAIQSLRPHGIVRPDFVDDLRQRLLPAHPAYYGTMMWVLMMLGLWLHAKRL